MTMTFEQARAKALAAGATDADIEAEARHQARHVGTVPFRNMIRALCSYCRASIRGGLDSPCCGAQSKEGVETMSRFTYHRRSREAPRRSSSDWRPARLGRRSSSLIRTATG
jgi:hypothetical protein